MKHTFTSHLSKEQFLEALKLYGRDEKELWEFRLLSEKVNHFYYKISGDNFKITKPTYLSHPFKAMFYGEVFSAKSGSKIEGEFNMPIFVKAFMIFWIGMIIYVFYLATSWLGPAIINGGRNRDDFVALLIVILFILLWFSLTRFPAAMLHAP